MIIVENYNTTQELLDAIERNIFSIITRIYDEQYGTLYLQSFKNTKIDFKDRAIKNIVKSFIENMPDILYDSFIFGILVDEKNEIVHVAYKKYSFKNSTSLSYKMLRKNIVYIFNR